MQAERDASSWSEFCDLALADLDAVATRLLDRALARRFPTPPEDLLTAPINLLVLASSTVDHLLPAIRVGALRRGIWLRITTPPYGQYVQTLLDPSSIPGARPDAVLFSLDARSFIGRLSTALGAGESEQTIKDIVDDLVAQWARTRAITQGQIIQQTLLPVLLPLIGENEHRLPGAPFSLLQRLNLEIRARADAAGVDVLSIDTWAARDGIAAWHDPALWHRAKQEIHPSAAPFYGDLVGRLLAAAQGQSRKALVLDLDNTLWGGVVGDDGLAGIALGQGSAAGEAFVDFQKYAKALSRRGVILAVCSKNDEATALEPFQKHPEMVLERSDIACFVANWTDKATNLRHIAQELNIGLDSMVFVDDNPAERSIVRRELPMIGVPELPEDVTLFPATLAAAGYFEAREVTREDLQRGRQYQANAARSRLVSAGTDIEGYLRSLQMRAVWSRFQGADRARLVQLINKTNQFNLTTRRLTDVEVSSLVADATALTLQIRLLDQFGDNGIVAIVIGVMESGTRDIVLHNWLMSCRVLGRGVEQETLNLVVAQARALGAHRLIGLYVPSPKNGIVRELYDALGFTSLDDGRTRFALDLAAWSPISTHIAAEPAVLA